jgi:hypothetical protein
MVPHNEAIDVTNSEDMTFKWQLNGNNLLCAYNIQIFDIDTNELVYELVSTENQRAIQANINRLSGYITNQENKLTRLEEYKTEYGESTLRSEFRYDLEDDRIDLLEKYDDMAETLSKLKSGKTLTQSEITKYFQYWGEAIETIKARVGRVISDATGEPVQPDEGSAEYIKMQIETWSNIDPARTDGIEYEGDVELIDSTAFNTVKDELSSYSDYYDNVMAARRELSASDTSFINDTTLDKAKKTIYLMYSKHTNESYYAKDLWAAVDSMWKSLDFDKKEKECRNYLDKYQAEIEQESYALAHLNGGKVTAETNAYSTTNATEANLVYRIPKDGEVAIIDIDPQPPTGWAYIIYDGQKAYIQTANLEYYNIEDGKYYLDNPVPPTNYEGEANVINHQLPTNVLENGKSYKWSVTLYWSTSGDYTKDEEIDGKLTSVECYFDARKRPVVYLKNLEQVFTIPYNYVKIATDTSFLYDDADGNQVKKELKAGETVLFLHKDADDENYAYIRTVDENNVYIYGDIPISTLENEGLYEEGVQDLYELQSKYVTFIGGYEQEQHVSISYFRWVLSKLQYDSEEVDEIVEDTGMIPSIDVKFFYDGFLNGEKYSIKLYVQTLDNVEAESIEYKFKVQYIDISIENMVNAENSPIEHGIIVEWSNLRLIQGEVIGGYSYTDDLPNDSQTSISLEEGSTLTFDEDKGNPLSIDWSANHIISMRIDKDRPEDQVYYTASGLDDNGEVIYKTLELVNRADTDTTGIADFVYTVHTATTDETYTQEIIASPLYWYIIILKQDGFIVYRKYADGLFPMRELYASYNGFTNDRNPVPLPLRYYDEPSERVNYNYQTIIRNDGTYRE